MKICAVYGTERRGCTWHIAQEVLSRLPEAEVTEFFLPRDCARRPASPASSALRAETAAVRARARGGSWRPCWPRT